MIDEFVASVFADSVAKVSLEHRFTCESLQDEVFADHSFEITRDFSHLEGICNSRHIADDTDDGFGEEQRATRQKISQILDMGIIQAGLSRNNVDTNEDTDSEPDSESGVSMTGSSTAKLSNDTGMGSHSAKYENRSSFQKISVISSSSRSNNKRPSMEERKLRRHVSWNDGGDPDTQGQSVIDIIQEDAKTWCFDLIKPSTTPRLSSAGISTYFLDNMM